MSELPTGWAVCLLDDVIKVQNGYAFPSKDFQQTGVPVIRQSNLDGNRVSLEHCVYLDAKWLKLKPDFILRKNDVLIGMSGSVGKLCVYDIDKPALQNQRTGKMVPFSIDFLDWRFMWEYLKTIEQQLMEKAKGLGVVNVSAIDIESLPFRLAPLNEQRRLVAKLEMLLDKVDACQKRLAKIPVILKRFRQSVLAAACSGRLTADWREKNSHDKEWVVHDLSEVGSVTGGITKNSKRNKLSLQTPYLRVANVYQNRLELGEVFKIGVTEQEFERARLVKEDILFVEGNGSLDQIGRVALWDGSIARCVHQNHLIKFRSGKGVIPIYVLLQMMAPEGRAQLIEKATSTAGLHTLSISKISDVTLPVPPLPEQKEIVRRVEALFALADQIEARYIKANAYVDKLTQSILAKAFRGELVPQDPNDEPASVLLEKIKAEREKNEKKNVRSKGNKQ
ncbi:MAG: restriction endonuclease subunit S [Nitrospirae bacterium]|nr:restriction endonuclease subunit S [Nitrospirota bacterium]